VEFHAAGDLLEGDQALVGEPLWVAAQVVGPADVPDDADVKWLVAAQKPRGEGDMTDRRGVVAKRAEDPLPGVPYVRGG
jgi:hypothetical protein